MKITLLLLGLLSAIFCLPATAETPKISQYTLDNGLTIILCERHELPTVFGGVVARVGSKDDPADATGLAHYMEHMLFKGTTRLGTTDWESEKPYIDSIFLMYDLLGTKSSQPARDSIQQKINELSVKAGSYAIPNDMDNLLRGFGSTGINAGTANDWTAYYNEFPPSQLQKWLTLYAHRFEEPVFRLFQSELETVYEEKNMYSDFFFYPMLEEFMKNLYRVHPYGQQTALGTMEHLKNPSLSRMKEFYETWYVPGNMALILIGDFATDEAKPLIEATFGTWEPGNPPDHSVWDEQPASGREFVEVKMSPVKMELLGFKTIPSNHPDKEIMDVCNYLISNEGKTGLLDQLVLENKLLEAQMLTMPCNDLLSTILFVVPKLVGQSLDEAEQLALGELKKLSTGSFSDELLKIAKLEIARTYKLEMEDNMNLGLQILDTWYDKEPVEILFGYPERIDAITRDDIIRFASAYYGDNYLAFHSKMGSADKEKIDKPGYDPVQGEREAVSEFATLLEGVPALEPRSRFVDFNQDIMVAELAPGVQYYAVSNPDNDIFTLKIKYAAGTHHEPLLVQAASLMNYASVEGMTLDSLKKSFALIGTSYQFSADASYFTLELTGPDAYFKDAVELVKRLVINPKADNSRMEKVIEEVEANRKMEDADADAVADALLEYAIYGAQSEFLHRASVKELKKSEAQELLDVCRNAMRYEAEVHYCGSEPAQEIADYMQAEFPWEENPVPGLAPDIRSITRYEKNNLIIVDKPKATQSKIYFYLAGKPYSTAESASYDAFNFYFGGGFSGLVLQEIRESRSLAYAAGARFRKPPLENSPALFYGYIGTQDDKTVEAVSVFTDLVRNMPRKEERMGYIREFLTQASLSSRPSFRDISETYISWKRLGYTSDPNEALAESFRDMDFQLLLEFYESHLQEEPLTVCIVGDKKRIDTQALQQFGKISYVKEKKLYRK